ncbi:hypothetical protein [Bifidobacterium catulorum]|uniref:Uncharacterized protein n=1 Tax=Bifidobacterium catulorum TaxID=1630173 RepID=A0A2U2MTQ0_9BIFI|nr:hypothetical protein [Bifidobacterium catulorum]PWG60205.1 hypothetical protein DF200_03990 [Bifidobacterium catulorum]
MPKLENKIRGAFRRFISNTYRTGVIDGMRIVGVQVRLGEFVGKDANRGRYWGNPADGLADRINRYRAWADGASDMVLETVAVMAECRLDDSASYPWGKIQTFIENALSRFEQNSLRERESLGLGQLLIDDSDYLSSVMKPWAIFSDGEESDQRIARFIDDTVNDWRENYTRDSGLRLLKLIKELEDDDEEAAMAIVSLSIEACAFWHMQKWRYRRGEQGERPSEEAWDIYALKYNEEYDRARDNGYAPTTVTDAMKTLIDAYGHGKSAFDAE